MTARLGGVLLILSTMIAVQQVGPARAASTVMLPLGFALVTAYLLGAVADRVRLPRLSGYLLFGPPYDCMARDARERGWDVVQIPGGHLHHLVDPGAVAARIIAMTRRWASPPR